MDLKDLANYSSELEKAFGITSTQMGLLLELLNKRKIAQPVMAFKAGTANMAKPGKKPFVFVEEEKGSFFFYNLQFPMLKKDIQPKLKGVEKALKKAADTEKEVLEAQKVFLELLLERIKKKKWLATSGRMAWKNTNANTQECFMSLEGKIEGPHKSSLDVALSKLDYDFTDKNGNLLRILGSTVTGESTEETTSEGEENTDTSSPSEGSTSSKGQEKRAQQLGKIDGGIGKMEAAVGRVSKEKLLPNIEKYELALAKLREEALADGTIDEKEQKAIDKAEEALAAIKAQVETGDADRTAKRAQNKAKIKKYKAQLDKLAKKLGIR